MAVKKTVKKTAVKKGGANTPKKGEKGFQKSAIVKKKAPTAAKKVTKTPVKTVAIKKVTPVVAKKSVLKKALGGKLSFNDEPVILEDVNVELDFAAIEAEIEFNEYVENFKPTTKGFVSAFRVRVTQQMETHSGASWVGEIYRDGRKVGIAENKGDGGANYYYFDRREDRSDWEDEATTAYEGNMNEGDEDFLFAYLDSLSTTPKLSDLYS